MPRLSSQANQLPVVLVAGAAGFLGSHICESLVQSGVKVVGLDDLATGSLSNLAAIRQHPNFEFIEYNINQGTPPGLVDRTINYVIHAAGVETHGENSQATLAMALTGSFGTKYLLDLAVSHGARFLLVSSLGVYDGLASSTSLSYYYGSDPSQEARFSQYETKRYAEGLCELYAREYNLDARVARVSQLYGPRMDLRSPELISRLINMAVTGKDLQVDVDGSTVLLLTFVADAVYGISRLLFADGSQYTGTIYPLYNPEKVSAMSVAYTLKEFLPEGKAVSFVAGKEALDVPMSAAPLDRTKRDLGWEPSVGISRGLTMTIESFKVQPPDLTAHQISKQQLETQNFTPKAPIDSSSPVEASTSVKQDLVKTDSEPIAASKKTRKRKAVMVRPWWRRLFVVAFIVGAYFAFLQPAAVTVAYGVSGAWAARVGVDQARSLEFDRAEHSLSAAAYELRAAERSSAGLVAVARWTGQGQELYQLQQLLLGASFSLDGGSALARAAEPIYTQGRQLLSLNPSAQEGNFASDVEQAKIAVAQARRHFSGADLAFNQPQDDRVAGVSAAENYGRIGNVLTKYLEIGRKLNLQFSEVSSSISEGLEVAPALLGQGQTKRYLLMVQNSNELRPTGGFAGSYVLVTVQNGRVANLKIDDIYNPVGQSESQVRAPAPLARAVSHRYLQLTDANWWPDAPTSAEMIAGLYQDATDTPIDGVVFVTTQAIKQVMLITGSLELQDYPEVVTADNFAQLAQIYSDVNFVPGSTAKKDFLAALTDGLLAKVQSGNSETWSGLGRAMMIGAERGEVMAWMAEEKQQQFISQAGWAGEMAETKGDYLRVVDANLGINKANYYVERETAYDINVDRQSNLSGVVTVKWKHSGTSATWPGGDYVNYVRVYVPQGATLRTAEGFTDGKVTTELESGKQVFGGFVTIPYNSQASVRLEYYLPQSLSLPMTNGRYSLLWQKQAGIAEEPLRVTFNTPLFLKASNALYGGRVADDGRVVWQGRQIMREAQAAVQFESRAGRPTEASP